MADIYDDDLWRIPRRFSRWECLMDMRRVAAPRRMKVLHSGKQIMLEKGELIADVAELAINWGWESCSVKSLLNDWVKSKRISYRNVDGVKVVSVIEREAVKKPKKEKAVFDLSFVADEFKDLFDRWLAYRNAVLKRPFKTQKGVEGSYNELIKLSGGNLQRAEEIVNQSIEREYQGLFPVRAQRVSETPKRSDEGMNYNETW